MSYCRASQPLLFAFKSASHLCGHRIGTLHLWRRQRCAACKSNRGTVAGRSAERPSTPAPSPSTSAASPYRESGEEALRTCPQNHRGPLVRLFAMIVVLGQSVCLCVCVCVCAHTRSSPSGMKSVTATIDLSWLPEAVLRCFVQVQWIPWPSSTIPTSVNWGSSLQQHLQSCIDHITGIQHYCVALAPWDRFTRKPGARWHTINTLNAANKYPCCPAEPPPPPTANLSPGNAQPTGSSCKPSAEALCAGHAVQCVALRVEFGGSLHTKPAWAEPSSKCAVPCATARARRPL